MKKFLPLFLVALFSILLISCGPGQRPAQIYKNTYIGDSGQSQAQQLTPDTRYLDAESERQELAMSRPDDARIESTPLPELTGPIPGNQASRRIAVIIPLSGSNADLGKSMMDAAQLALFDLGNPDIELLPLDSKSTPEGAREAAREAINKGASLVLGPVFTDTTQAAAEVIGDKIPILSFSNNTALTRRNVYLLGFIPEQQIERVVEFAERQGIRQFSALAPRDSFGEVSLSALRSALSGSPKRIERYNALDATVSNAIERLIARDVPIEYPESVSLPLTEPKTEAILLPEGGRTAISLASRIFRHGNDSGRFRLLGSGQWDDVQLLKEQKLYGSWFASSAPNTGNMFEQHFKKTFGYEPIRIASLAYDGVALAAFLASKSSDPTQPFRRSDITSSDGFSGINGVFRIRKDGRSERALAVIEITRRGFEVLDPAPDSFGGF